MKIVLAKLAVAVAEVAADPSPRPGESAVKSGNRSAATGCDGPSAERRRCNEKPRRPEPTGLDRADRVDRSAERRERRRHADQVEDDDHQDKCHNQV